MRKLFTLLGCFAALPATAGEDTRIQIKGEIIDTWCYYSGVMGGPEAVTGSAHRACALWCSAGGIPVGLLAEDGTVYMIIKINNDSQSAGGDTLLRLAANTVEVDAITYSRDGINYLVVSQVINDFGITNLSHEDYGVVPGFAIPEPKG